MSTNNYVQQDQLSLDSASYTVAAEHDQSLIQARVDLPMRAFAWRFLWQPELMYDYLGIEYTSLQFILRTVECHANQLGENLLYTFI